MRKVFDNVLEPRTLLCALLVAGFLLYNATAFGRLPGSNGWDLVLPVVGDGKVLALCLPLWLTVVVLAIGGDRARSEELFRHGSRIAALWSGVRDLAERLTGLAVVLGAAVACALLAHGPSSGWSDLAFGRSSTQLDFGAFATQRLSEYFPSPLIAFAALAGYAGLACLALGALYLALVIVGRRRMAATVLLSLVFWSALCSFGAAGGIVAVDLVNFIDLFWALRNGVAWCGPAVAALLLGVAAGLVAHADRGTALSMRSQLQRPVALLLLLALVAALALPGAVADGNAGSDHFLARWEAFYAGANGSVFDYAQMILVTLGYATLAVARVASHLDGRYSYEAIRYGSQRAWLDRILAREALLAVAFGLSAPFVVGIVLAGARAGSVSLREVLLAVLQTVVLFTLQILFLTTLGLAALLITGSASAWVAAAAVTTAVGYPLIVDLGEWNAFAIASSGLDTGRSMHGGIFVAVTVTVAIAIVLLQKASRSRLATP